MKGLVMSTVTTLPAVVVGWKTTAPVPRWISSEKASATVKSVVTTCPWLGTLSSGNNTGGVTSATAGMVPGWKANMLLSPHVPWAFRAIRCFPAGSRLVPATDTEVVPPARPVKCWPRNTPLGCVLSCASFKISKYLPPLFSGIASQSSLDDDRKHTWYRPTSVSSRECIRFRSKVQVTASGADWWKLSPATSAVHSVISAVPPSAAQSNFTALWSTWHP
mmetsp:Transcript_95179/g.254458  ORF Transcript_95179/g.254458 Transcript_95179/m.254458 type:complete len:220 (+) Transcript_95179:3614-4273(+)